MSEYLRYKGQEVIVSQPDFDGYRELICLECMETLGKIPCYLLETDEDNYLSNFFEWLQKSRPSVIEHLEDHRIQNGPKYYRHKIFPSIRLIRE